ncbi:putative Peptidyl-prolyl cis-trans isomerase [Zostera marina]|uniref:Peptidyl-prolyl cis-trans isomerase n=1 Tax=Zostera marina TaxID=29655 RepID=A0A0K9NXK1_ZOSMR|nr:putative Peptidyl-prolyl cis-trans isomerase [Zostera marina]
MAKIKPQALLLQSKKKKGPSGIGLPTIITCNVIVILIVISLYCTYKHWQGLWYRSYKRSNQLETEFNNSEKDLESLGETKKYDLPNYVIMNTSKGIVSFELLKDSAPGIVDQFLDLCQKEYFKGVPFHHVIKNFVIQGGGGLNRMGDAEDWTLKRKSDGHLASSEKHEAFMLGTCNVKQESNEFQFLITTSPIPDLDDKLFVFGRIINGEEVIQEIEEVDTDEHYRPKSTVSIVNIILKHEL